MSLEINKTYDPYPIDYAKRPKAGQEKVNEADRGHKDEKVSDKRSDLHDAYISGEKSGAKHSGLYRLGQDENGRKKVFFDDPKKAGSANKDGASKIAPDNPAKPAKKCTSNTDKVDREIEKLKEKKQQLEQQIQSAAGDAQKVKELEKKLAQVENELSQKDNDTYRRQHSTFSE